MGEMGKPETDRDPARLQRFHRSIERVLDFLNHELQGQEYLAQQFSIADIGFVPRLVVLKDLGLDPAQNRPNVDAWLNRMIDRPSIQSLEGLTVQLLAGV
jgi:glutathione S-transferase